MARIRDQSGNPSGKVASKPFLDALNRALAQSDGKLLRAAADKLLAAAAQGEPWALQMLADRLDGRPAQAVTGEDGGPLQAVITWAKESK